jgi:hypothetical protein
MIEERKQEADFCVDTSGQGSGMKLNFCIELGHSENNSQIFEFGFQSVGKELHAS